MSYSARLRPARFFPTVIALILLSASIATAEWSHDPASNLRLSGYPGAYYQIEAVEDGSVGMISVWDRYHSIHAQRFDADGDRMRGSTDLQWFPVDAIWGEFRLVSDGAGGAYFVWHDPGSEAHIVRAQHFDATGQPTWDPAGVQVIGFYIVGTVHSAMEAAPDGDGGLLVTWVNEYDGTRSVQVQRFGPDGSRPDASTLASSGLYDVDAPVVVAAEFPGSAAVAWQERSGSVDWDIIGQYKAETGQNLWDTTGKQVVISTGGDQTAPQIAVAGNGRIIYLCEDDATGSPGLRFGQKADSGGFYGYISSQGRAWSGLFDVQDGPALSRDATGNVYALCTDRSESGGGRIAA